MVALASLALSACGEDTPDEVVQQTADQLGQIRSGILAVDVSAAGRGGGSDADLGFSLRGPFALAEKGALPVAELTYEQRNGSVRESATFVSTGERAWIRTSGGTNELTGAGADRLRAARGPGAQGLGALRIDHWIRDARLQRAGDVDRIRARLDVGAALDDLARLMGSPDGMGADARAQFDRAVRDAPVMLETGAEDRLLRRLRATIELELAVPEAVRQRFGELVGGKVKLDLKIERPNEPVDVQAP